MRGERGPEQRLPPRETPDADRLRRASARDAAGGVEPDDRRDRAPGHRRRPWRLRPLLVGLLCLHADVDDHRPALREAVRRLRPAAVLLARDRALHDRLRRQRPRAVDDGADPRPRDPGSRRGRPDPTRDGRDRRPDRAARARQVAGLDRRSVRRGLRRRAGDGRVDLGQRELAVGLLRQPAVRALRARRGAAWLHDGAEPPGAFDRLHGRGVAQRWSLDGSPRDGLGRDAVSVGLARDRRHVRRERAPPRRLRRVGKTRARADPPARAVPEPDVRRVPGRVVLHRRGDVRDDPVRPALRAGRAGRERHELRRDPDALDARPHRCERRLRPAHLAHGPLQGGAADEPRGARRRVLAAVAARRPLDAPRDDTRHDRRRARPGPRHLDLRPRRPERRPAQHDGGRDREHTVLPHDRRDDRGHGDGRDADEQPPRRAGRPAFARAAGGRRRRGVARLARRWWGDLGSGRRRRSAARRAWRGARAGLRARRAVDAARLAATVFVERRELRRSVHEGPAEPGRALFDELGEEFLPEEPTSAAARAR